MEFDKKSLSVSDLMNDDGCCGLDCLNCPFYPRWQIGAKRLYQPWVDYSMAHPEGTFIDYIASLKSSN